jgi:SsrA-binding protein
LIQSTRIAASKPVPSSQPDGTVLATHRKARFHYQILDTIEAGIELTGTEVKAIKNSLISLDESFATVENGQAWLQNAHVQPYAQGNRHNHPSVRPRRLLLHKREILKWGNQASQKGLTIVPLDVHLRRGRIKVLLGLGKGKEHQDKRETIKARESKRETDRILSQARKSG